MMSSTTTKSTDQRSCSFMDTIGQMVLNVFNSLNDSDGTNGNKKLSTTSFCKAISSKCTDNNNKVDDDPKIFRQFKISMDTIQNLEEFEAIHETQIRFEFHNRSNHHHASFVQLNPLEQSCLETLGQILDPLRYSWSATSYKHAQLKQYIQNSLNQIGDDVRPSQKTIISACESGINLLIQLTKQIDTFACLTSNDQMLLLQHSIMSIMTLRSILLSDRKEPFPATCPQSSDSHNSVCKRKCPFLSDSSSDEDDDRNSHSPKPSKTLLKRMCLDAFCSNPHQDYDSSSTTTTMQCNGILDGYMGKDHGKTSTPPPLPPPPPPQPSLLSSLLSSSSSSPSSSSAASTVAAAATTSRKPIPITNHPAQTAQINVPNEKTITIPDTEMGKSHKALEYEMRFVQNYQTLLRTIDPCWSRDKYIFYLLFVIALFQTNHYCSGNIENIAKVRRSYFTYVYLLKRYLQQKFHHQPNNRSVARSHYIRLIDLIQQVQSMNRNIIQKLLGFQLSDAHNLLEKLCGC